MFPGINRDAGREKAELFQPENVQEKRIKRVLQAAGVQRIQIWKQIIKGIKR